MSSLYKQLLILILFLLFLPLNADADILEVGGSGLYTEIQPAIVDAVDGDTVLVNDGTYIENIDFLGKNITVKSVNGRDATIIDGNKNGSVVSFASGETAAAALDGFTITNGSGTIIILLLQKRYLGGGIYCVNASSPTIKNCTITGNTALTKKDDPLSTYGFGGGIYCKDGSSPTITNCMITGNDSDAGGGAIHSYGSYPAMTNCTMTGNFGPGGGILCEQSSYMTITDCTINENTTIITSGGAGGIYCRRQSTVVATNCTISYNTNFDTPNRGIRCTYESNLIITDSEIIGNGDDGIYMFTDCDLTMTNSIIRDNAGFGIFAMNSCTLSLTDSTISNNTMIGIDILNSSNLTLNGCTVKRSGDHGIEIINYSTLTMSNSSLLNNNLGLGLYLFNSSSATVTESEINNNNVGAGCADDCTMTLSDSTIMGNIHGLSFTRNSPTITNCNIIKNYSLGIKLRLASPIITNCIITGNGGVSDGSIQNGGGISCDRTSSPTLTNCTIANNKAERNGGGISCTKDSSPSFKNCIIWGNSAKLEGDDIYIDDSLVLVGIEYSDIDTNNITGAADSWVALNCINADPLFKSPLNDDFHLASGSPCIDKATPIGAPDGDIDGDTRPIGEGFDIGADEAWITFYIDADGDGYGDPSYTGTEFLTDPGTGYSLTNDDCNDSDASIYPGAQEICGDGIDQDCSSYDVPCEDDDQGDDGGTGGGTTGGTVVENTRAPSGGGGGGGCFIAEASYVKTEKLTTIDKVIVLL